LSLTDLLLYSRNPKNYLTIRKQKLGKNFAALGRIIIGDYELVYHIIEKLKQTRSSYISRIHLNNKLFGPTFLLFISNTPKHQNIKNRISTITNNYSLQDLNSIIHTFHCSHKHKKTSFDTKTLQFLIIQLVHNAVAQISLTHQQLTDFYNLTFGFQSILYQDSIVPYYLHKLFFSNSFNQKIHNIYKNSPLFHTLQQDNPDLTYSIFAHEMYEMLSIAATTGTFNLLQVCLQQLTLNPEMFAFLQNLHIPNNDFCNFIITQNSDYHTILQFVLESARYNAPVNNINIILDSPLTLTINNITHTIPQNTLVSANINLANHDSDKYNNPSQFNIQRDFSDFLGFNGINNPRVCPGRQLATHIIILFLLHKVKGHSSH